MNIEQVIDFLESNTSFQENISYKGEKAEMPASFEQLPQSLDKRIQKLLQEDGIDKLYSHQYEAYQKYRDGKNYVITTPTASGKTMGYLLPILQDKIEHANGRHLFMFPTKALAQDQLSLYRRLNSSIEAGWKISTFDGDTPPEERRSVKRSGDFILTNPDMLHAGILPHHTTWKNLFQNLRTIVIDEMHTYLGVFGSHLANVLRRFNRLLKHYGSEPIYIFSSATIANPLELASNLSEQEFELIENSGAPEGKRHYVFYNPPVIDEAGNRRSPYQSAANVGQILIKNTVPVIIFARSRIRVELLTNLLKEKLPHHLKNKVMGYRGGYLPNERRKIEKSLREGELLAVVSTNALELGIDIGMLQAVITVGYPGRISSLMQQFGRAGRKKESSLAIMIATPSALDQYLLNNPSYITESKGEAAIINPDNMMIFMEHLKCASYEMYFHAGDVFGTQTVDEYLNFFAEANLLIEKNGVYYWSDRSYPASEISLRSAAQENFVIVDISQKSQEKVIGEVDFFSAPTLVHEDAIYMHQGKHFFVKRLKWDERRAEVISIKSDYYTDAHEKVNLSLIFKDKSLPLNKVGSKIKNLTRTQGEITVLTKAYLFKKIKITSNENLGWGNIDTPELEKHTQAAWISFDLENEYQVPALAGEIMIRLAYLFRQMAPLIALCDIRDIHCLGLHKDTDFGEYAVVFYDNYPGGVGLSYKVLANFESLLTMAQDVHNNCDCDDGCPSCIGVWDDDDQDDSLEIHKEIEHGFSFKKAIADLLTWLACTEPVEVLK